MKKYILIAVTLFIASFAYTQSDKEEMALMQAAFGMDKREVVAEFVKPSFVGRHNTFPEYNFDTFVLKIRLGLNF